MSSPTDMAATMDALAAAIPTAASTRVYAYPVDDVAVPSVVVSYPTTIDFDVTFGDGSDRLVFPIFYIVSRVMTKAARDALSAVIGGAKEVKVAIETNAALLAVIQSVRVTECRIEPVTVAGVTYIGAVFEAEIYT